MIKKIAMFTTLLVNLLFSSNQSMLINVLDTNSNVLTKNFAMRNISLPQNAMILKEVVITYETIEKKVEKQKIVINEKIKHSDPILIISNSIFESASDLYSPVLQASLETSPKLSFQTKQNEITDNKSSENATKNDAGIIKPQQEVKELKDFILKIDENIEIYFINKTLHIQTKVKIQERFNAINNQKIILDLFDTNIKFPIKTYNINKYGFKDLKIGSSKDYHMLIFAVDKDYKNYSMQKTNNAYIIKID